MGMTVYDLTGLPLMEQAKTLYNNKNASGLAINMQSIWPLNTPQKDLFHEIYVIPLENPRKDEVFDKLTHFALYDAATEMGKECRTYIKTIAKQEDSEFTKEQQRNNFPNSSWNHRIIPCR